MKKLFAIMLTVAMSVAACGMFTACGGSKSGKTAYVLCETGDTYSQGLGSSFKKAYEDLGGTVIMESFPKNTSEFTSYIQKAIDKNVDVVFAPNSTTVAVNLIKQAYDAGLKAPLMAGDTWEHADILNAAKGKDLDVYCSTFFDESDSAAAATAFVNGFKAWLNANADKKTANGGNDIVAAVSALGFDAYNVAYAAIEKAAAEKGEDLTSVDVAKALWTVEYTDAVTGAIKFDTNGDAIKDTAYIKKAAGDKFQFIKTQSVENNAAQGSVYNYNSNKYNTIDKVNKIIKIGVFEPQSGDNGNGGKQEVIAIQYARSLKPTIKIGESTYTIELVEADNQSSDAAAPTAAGKIVSEGAIVSLGSYGSGVSIAANETFEKNGVPAIGVSCTNAAVTLNHPYYFRICFLDPFQGSVMANFAMSLSK